MKYILISLFIFCISCAKAPDKIVIQPQALNQTKCPPINVLQTKKDISLNDDLFKIRMNVDNAACIANENYITLSADINIYSVVTKTFTEDEIVALPLFYKISLISNKSSYPNILQEKYFFTSAEFIAQKNQHDIKHMRSFRIAKSAHQKENLSLNISFLSNEDI